MKHTFLLLSAAFAAVVISACNQAEKTVTGTPAATDPLAVHIDSGISPGKNFFLFANNAWFRNNPVPSSESSNGIFRTIQDTINDAVKKICERSAGAKNAARGSNEQKIGDFYFSGMDTASIEKNGLSPLKAELENISSIRTLKDVFTSATYLNTIKAESIYSFYITRDQKNSSRYSIYFNQPSLGLPEKEYYFGERTAAIREAYKKHVSVILKLSGTTEKEAADKSSAILQLETSLAGISRKMEDLRDPYKNYNKMNMAQLAGLCPSGNWSDLVNAYKLTGADTIVVGQPEYFKGLEGVLKKYDVPTWKAYLTFILLDNYAEYLNRDLEKEDFYFQGTVMNGIKEQKPRWKRVVENTDHMLGELVGQVYVNDYLPKGTKEKLQEIGENIRTVFGKHLRELDWMSEATKAKALDKLNKLVMKVGYPDKWKDMSTLEITRQSYAANVLAVNKWKFNFMLGKWGKPVDRNEWDMFPQTYNAYYEPTNNEIVVPACNILVPGYENRIPDDAILYGIIGGSTFGHEITHGFDDQGSQYDANGNLSNWWTKEDREKFMARTKLIVEQFNRYTVLDSLHLNGKNTQGENIADLGGVVMGYEAFKATAQGKSTEKTAGMTPDERFFLAYGYAWMIQQTEAALSKQVMSNEHSPAMFRVNGPLSNVEPFYSTFHIKEGDEMYRAPDIRVKIW